MHAGTPRPPGKGKPTCLSCLASLPLETGVTVPGHCPLPLLWPREEPSSSDIFLPQTGGVPMCPPHTGLAPGPASLPKNPTQKEQSLPLPRPSYGSESSALGPMSPLDGRLCGQIVNTGWQNLRIKHRKTRAVSHGSGPPGKESAGGTRRTLPLSPADGAQGPPAGSQGPVRVVGGAA